ncbi:hypothetical protein F4820DRAFT_444785 [Hypoxylon rubiginosum]|uniref:Uncharacterized protein n=1 Tax=Hypoxylon rubiginosum TaxID=110542 RepID=A0ACB9ZAU6_9PEZI|nr:hypothetical protein F4820DRAFT_444785 [Hypoxylon rubiginosum]
MSSRKINIPPINLSTSGDERPDWGNLNGKLDDFRQNVEEAMAVLGPDDADADEFQDEYRAYVESLQLSVDGLRARGAVRAPAPASLAERVCLLAADQRVAVAASADELMFYFAGFSGVRTAADLHAHVVDAREVQLAYGAYAEARGGGAAATSATPGTEDLPSPDAAYFLAGFDDEYFDRLADEDRDAMDWDAARCVLRIVRFLESYACAAIPWSSLPREGQQQQLNEAQEDEARERYAIGLRVFSYLHARAVRAAQQTSAEREMAQKIKEWNAEIPERGFLDPQAWSDEEADEIARLESRRQGIDETQDRQQILLGALMHWDEISDDRKHGTKTDFLTKLKRMFSRRS